MDSVKSNTRVADHGEVFTPEWMVEAILDLVKDETERIDSRFLEPACGSGAFLVQIVRRKLAAVELKCGKSDFERRQDALLALMCVYRIELLKDNTAECHANVLEILAECHELYRAASFVLSQNLVHGDALTMRTHEGQPITFAEWGYLGKGKFQRRDFRLATLAQSSTFSAAGSLFASWQARDIHAGEDVRTGNGARFGHRDARRRPQGGGMSDKPIRLTGPPEGYADWLAELKARIHGAQQRATGAVNRELVLLYWQIGRDILARQALQGWGSKVIERLSQDLRAAFPEMKGFSPRNLKYMRAFAAAWPDDQFVQEVLAQLPCYHQLALLDKLPGSETRS